MTIVPPAPAGTIQPCCQPSRRNGVNAAPFSFAVHEELAFSRTARKARPPAPIWTVRCSAVHSCTVVARGVAALTWAPDPTSAIASTRMEVGPWSTPSRCGPAESRSVPPSVHSDTRTGRTEVTSLSRPEIRRG